MLEHEPCGHFSVARRVTRFTELSFYRTRRCSMEAAERFELEFMTQRLLLTYPTLLCKAIRDFGYTHLLKERVLWT